MDFAAFQASLQEGTPPAGVGGALLALWHEARGDWEMAHRLVQSDEGETEAWVHAYLHRKEGDLGNAAFWYARAGRTRSTLSIEAEWEEIARALLESSASERSE